MLSGLNEIDERDRAERRQRAERRRRSWSTRFESFHSAISIDISTVEMPGRKARPRKGDTTQLETFEDFADGALSQLYANATDARTAAVYQEEQGERYQTGDKAARHYREAKRLYEEALSLQPGSGETAYALCVPHRNYKLRH